MKEYAYYYETGGQPYVVFTMVKSTDVSGPTVYVRDKKEAISQAEHRNAERVNF